MNSILDILVSKNEFDNLGLVELLSEWGDETFSKEPPQYTYNSKLFFHIDFNVEYYQRILGEDLNVLNFAVLTLEGDSLSDLELLINKKQLEKFDNELLVFINKLYDKLDSFCIFKFRDEEDIDNKYIAKKVDKAIEIFCSSLKWESPEGIVIVKK